MSEQTTRIDLSNPPRHDDGKYREYLSTQPEGALTAPAENSTEATDDEQKQGRFAAWRERRRLEKERARALREEGYLLGTSTAAVVDPRSREGIEDFWDNHFVTAEQATETREGSYAVMSDDYTPGQTGGNALSGHRRTHRIAYEGAQTAVRMPSATSIRRFSEENKGRTFDVPVDATYPGGSVSGYVRVTANGPGQWSVSGVGMNEEANAYVSESVQAVLEARSVSRALKDVPDILERRTQRLAAAGAKQTPVHHSDWIRSCGYNPNSQEMVINLNGRAYGYRDVAPDTFDRLMNPGAEDGYSAGRVYNALVKRKSDVFQVEQCGKCGWFTEAGAAHRCRSQHHEREHAGSSAYAKTVRDRILRSNPREAGAETPAAP